MDPFQGAVAIDATVGSALVLADGGWALEHAPLADPC